MRRVLSNHQLYKNDLAEYSLNRTQYYYDKLDYSMFDLYSMSGGKSRQLSPDYMSNGCMSQDSEDFNSPLYQMSVTSFRYGKIRKIKPPLTSMTPKMPMTPKTPN